MKLQNLILITFLVMNPKPSFGIGFDTIGDFWDETRDSIEDGLGDLSQEIKNGGRIIINGTNQLISLAFDSLQDLQSYLGKARIEIPKLDTKRLKIKEDISRMELSMPKVSLNDVKLPKNAITIDVPRIRLKISDADLDNLKKAGDYISTPFENLYNWGKDRLATPSMEKCVLKPNLTWPKHQAKSKSQEGNFEECEFRKLEQQYLQDKIRLDELTVPMTNSLRQKTEALNQALKNIEGRAN